MISNVTNLAARRDLLWTMVVSDLKASTAETRLGWLWWLLDPLLMMVIYWGVVVGILGRGRPEYTPYPVFLLCALITWKHMAGAASKSTRVLVNQEGLIRSVPFPTMVLPLSLVLSGSFFFVCGLIVLLAAARIFPNAHFSGNHLALVQLPGLVALQVVIVAGLCLPLSCFGVILRDLNSFVGYALRVGFYLSPGLFGVDLVRSMLNDAAPGHSETLFALYMTNPFAILITGYRDALFYGRFIPWSHWAVLTVEAAALLLIGYRIYQSYDRRVIKFL